MTFACLIDPSRKNYFADFRLDSDELVFFIHVPKTAGTSFGREMRQRLQPHANLRLDYSPDAKPTHQQCEFRVNGFLRRADRKQLRFVSGHIPFRYSCKIGVVQPNVRFVTFLRNPVDRVVSDYRYQTTSAHPARDQFVKNFVEFGEYAESTEGRDKMYRFLCAYPNEPVEDVIERLSNRFYFVGTLGNYEICFNVLTALLGDKASPTVKTNRTNPQDAPKIELNENMIETIRSMNRRDVQLFDHFDRLWKKNADLIAQRLKLCDESSVEPVI